MEDWQYVLCLIGVVACAISSPIYCVRTLKKGEPCSAIIAALSITLGVALSLPFSRTREMWWFASAARVYFVTAFLSTLLYGLARLVKDKKEG